MIRSGLIFLLFGAVLGGAVLLAPAREGRGEEKEKVFAALYARGPEWVADKPVWEQPLEAHGEYMHSLYRAGKLLDGGPWLDHTGGLTLLKVASEESAREILARDPAIVAGVMRAELKPWYRVDWDSFGEPAKSPPPRGPSVGTVIIFTTRPAELAVWYAQGLGRPPFVARGAEHVGGQVGNLYLGFDLAAKGASPGPVTLWFTVDDLEATFQRFVDLGAKVRQKPAERPWGDRIAAVEDLDGNLLGLSQRR